MYLLLQGNLCPGKTTKIKPRSCVDHLRNGAHQCGYYKIYDAAGNGFTVYCDMETEPGAAWTLIVSWSLKNKDFSSFRWVCFLLFPSHKIETTGRMRSRDHITKFCELLSVPNTKYILQNLRMRISCSGKK